MSRLKEDSDLKSQSVAEICDIYAQATGRTHLNRSNSSTTLFIDWYRLLRVDEDAGIDVIRKQYHRLALLLHPDKNKHPKAELAFKLLSEAYNCLSDTGKRKAFNSERWRRNFLEFKNIPYESCNHLLHNPNSNSEDALKSHKYLQNYKQVSARFKDELTVIEKCLRKIGPREESPLFNPCDFSFPGYPHRRTRIYNKPEDLWCLQKGSMLSSEQGKKGKCDSPIFEVRSESYLFKSKSAHFSSLSNEYRCFDSR